MTVLLAATTSNIITDCFERTRVEALEVRPNLPSVLKDRGRRHEAVDSAPSSITTANTPPSPTAKESTGESRTENSVHHNGKQQQQQIPNHNHFRQQNPPTQASRPKAAGEHASSTTADASNETKAESRLPRTNHTHYHNKNAPLSTPTAVMAAPTGGHAPLRAATPSLPDHTLAASSTTASSSSSSNSIRRDALHVPFNSTQQQRQREEEEEFMAFCRNVLGIETILEIKTFEYDDHMKALPAEDWNDGDDDDMKERDVIPESQEPPARLWVRGLAASREIAEGEVVIRIPLQALLSVATTIDQDPVLSRVMGPEARRKHGWELDVDGYYSPGTTTEGAAGQADASYYYYEVPLLAVSLLHHRRLGVRSPLAPYIRMLETAPVDSMPFLWSPAQLKAQVSEGIRTVARGIRREMQDMYDAVVKVLIRDHPELFGPEGGFSWERFQWAFAMVNSRHWQLPIADLEADHALVRRKSVSHRDSQSSSSADADGQVPPANMPTEAWVVEHGDVDDEAAGGYAEDPPYRSHHSFLAPVADLLNFGPPCTRGSYNKESHTFEIRATCSFRKGQEVTFWYSDECDHIMVGVYGFMHPMVPPCPSAEEYRARSEDWRRQAESLQERLNHVYEDLDHAETELKHLQSILDHCECCGRYVAEQRMKRPADPRQGPATMPHTDLVSGLRPHEPSVRGSRFVAGPADIERHGVRRMWRESRKSEF